MLSLEADVPAIQCELSLWNDAMRKINEFTKNVDSISLDSADFAPVTSEVVRNLQELQYLCAYWVSDLRKTLIDTIPAGIQAYAGIFNEHALAILTAFNRDSRKPLQASIVQGLESLSHGLSQRLASARHAESQLNLFLINLGSITFETSENLEMAVNAVRLDVARLNELFEQLEALIAEESLEIRRIDYILRGEGDVSSDDIEPLFRNPITRGLAQVGFAISTFFGGADPAREHRLRIDDLIRRRNAMTVEQRSVAELWFKYQQIRPILDDADEALRASSRIVNIWSAYESKLASVATAITQAGTAEIASLSCIHLNAGVRSWRQLAEYARTLTFV